MQRSLRRSVFALRRHGRAFGKATLHGLMVPLSSSVPALGLFLFFASSQGGNRFARDQCLFDQSPRE
jgi:hypothetical protein